MLSDMNEHEEYLERKNGTDPVSVAVKNEKTRLLLEVEHLILLSFNYGEVEELLRRIRNIK